MSLKIKVKAEGKDAKKILSGQLPDASGANYISRNDLHIPAGGGSGLTKGAQHVTYKPRPGIAGKSVDTPELIGNEREQVSAPETGSLDGSLKPNGFGPSYVGEGMDTVQPCKREMNPIEAARQVNNQTRDMRTNLGRGKASQPTTDAGGQVTRVR